MFKTCFTPVRMALILIPGLFVLGSLYSQARDQEAGEAEKLVDQQLQAYNRHDLEAFLKPYAADVKIYDFPDKERMTGKEAMRKAYGTYFGKNPDLKAVVTKRIVQGDTIIDHEHVTATNLDFKAIAIYRIREGKINSVWFIRYLFPCLLRFS